MLLSFLWNIRVHTSKLIWSSLTWTFTSSNRKERLPLEHCMVPYMVSTSLELWSLLNSNWFWVNIHRAPANDALIGTSMVPAPPCIQRLLCPLIPTVMSDSSIESSGTWAAPAMLAQYTAFVTKISIRFKKTLGMSHSWDVTFLFHYNGFPLLAVKSIWENDCVKQVEEISCFALDTFETPQQTGKSQKNRISFFPGDSFLNRYGPWQYFIIWVLHWKESKNEIWFVLFIYHTGNEESHTVITYLLGINKEPSYSLTIWIQKDAFCGFQM